MNIGIIGAGNMGGALAAAFATTTHEVRVAASSPDSPRLQHLADTYDVTVGTPAEVVDGSDVVILAVPFDAVEDVLDREVATALSSGLLIDATNPLTDDFMGLTIGHTTSGGEHVARLVPEARVVKAFNTVFADALATPVIDGTPQVLPVAGDDDAAKDTVLRLGCDLGFNAVDAGPLSNARYTEPAVELLIQLGYGQGHGSKIGFALLG